MALYMENVSPCYKVHAMSLKSLLDTVPDKNQSCSQRIIAHFKKFKEAKHFSKNGSTSGLSFETIVTESLSFYGVHASRQKLHLKHDKTNVETDVFIVGAKRPIIILLKTSLRERWKQEDRDAMTIKSNAKGCADELYRQAGLGKFDSAYPPIIWALTWREKEDVTPDQAIAHAKRIGTLCAGIDTDRCISVFDEEGITRLLAECKIVE